MEITMTEFENLLKVKNQLIMFSGPELVEIYKDEDDFVCLLDTISLLSQTECAFLLLDDSFSEKIFCVLQDHRFRCDSEIKQVINEFVSYFNGLKAYSKGMINIMKNSYLSYQEEIRHVEFSSTDSLFSSIADDAIVLTSLKNGELERIEDGDYFMMSLNYLVDACPELFLESEVVERATSLLDKELKGSRIFSQRKKFVKETKKRLIDANKKEE